MGAAALGAIAEPLQAFLDGNMRGAQISLIRNFSVFDMVDNRFEFEHLIKGYAPLLAGIVGSKIVSSLGANRRLNLPFVKL